MTRLLFSTLLIVTLAASMACASSGGSSWNYSPASNEGPAHWENVVDSTTGKKCADCAKNSQSPINFGSVDVSTLLSPLALNWTAEGNPIVPGSVVKNTGHSIGLDLVGAGQEKLTLTDPNCGGKQYELKQFHLHAPSEHTFGGGLRDLEMHMVHQADDGAYLVIGVTFIAIRNGGNAFLNNFWEAIPGLNYEHGGTLPASNTTKAEFDLTDVLPASKNFYTYSGSFTTPPCTEGVTWYVMEEANTMSTAQLDAFMKTIDLTSHVWDGTSQFYSRGTYRPTQPLNGRPVKKFTSTSSHVLEAAAAQAAALAPGNSDSDSGSYAPNWVTIIAVVGMILGLIALVVGFLAVSKAGKAPQFDDELSAELN